MPGIIAQIATGNRAGNLAAELLSKVNVNPVAMIYCSFYIIRMSLMQKKLHILGICGTFMGGVARIARQLGFQVSGSDEQVYPPMSEQLAALDIDLHEGFSSEPLQQVDTVMVGNAMSRGNAAVEYALNQRMRYESAPAWLYDHVLCQRDVIAVAGTHGKTTTTAMVTWILRQCQNDCGYLIGGVANGFDFSADVGSSQHFVIEADEYDSAFFDKRSKFMHYRPRVLIINNLEFDHADIFEDLDAIKKQFRYLMRTVPGDGVVIYPAGDANVMDVIKTDLYAHGQSFGCDQGAWRYHMLQPDGSEFALYHYDACIAKISWSLKGQHNVANALAAFLAATAVGCDPDQTAAALAGFSGVKRRLELIAEYDGIKIYDDFAHHPTAIATTLAGVKNSMQTDGRLIAILQCASYTMKSGLHKERLKTALADADQVWLLRPQPDWGVDSLVDHHLHVEDSVAAIVAAIKPQLRRGDRVVIMSNRGFGGIYDYFRSPTK